MRRPPGLHMLKLTRLSNYINAVIPTFEMLTMRGDNIHFRINIVNEF